MACLLALNRKILCYRTGLITFSTIKVSTYLNYFEKSLYLEFTSSKYFVRIFVLFYRSIIILPSTLKLS